MSDLKPCPFCGSVDVKCGMDMETADYCVECEDCGAQGEKFDGYDLNKQWDPEHAEEKAAAAWNKRTT